LNFAAEDEMGELENDSFGTDFYIFENDSFVLIDLEREN